MKLFVSTGDRSEYVETRRIEIPANAVDHEIDNAGIPDIIALKNEPNVVNLKIDYEEGDLRIVNTLIDDVDDVTGVLTATVGFQLVDQFEIPILEPMLVEFGVFDDADLASPSLLGTLDTATQGTIVGSAGSSVIKVRTDENGEFECTLTMGGLGTVHLGCGPTFGSAITGCLGSEDITFTP